MLETAGSMIVRHGILFRGALGLLLGALVALAPAPAPAGGRGLRAAHGSHHPGSGAVHVSHGVGVVNGCGFGSARPGRLAPRPVAQRPLRGVRDPFPKHGFHEGPVVIVVDDGPDVVIEQPGVVIVIE